MKCKLLVVRHEKPTVAPSYKGHKRKYKGTTIEINEFWFCPDQIACWVMGPKHSQVLTWPKILEVWHVLTGTNFILTEVIELEEVGFFLQFNVLISPRRFLSSFRVVQLVLWTHPQPIHAERIPSLRNGNKFLEVLRHPPKIIAISGRVKGM